MIGKNICGYEIISNKSQTVGICRDSKKSQNYIYKIIEEFREIEIMQKIQGDYITKIIKDFQYEENKYVIIMEKGECDLRQYLNVNKDIQICEKNRYNLTMGILKGLQSMHKQKVWHRDLKPQNVYVFFKNPKQNNIKKDAVFSKLGDFGTSRIVKKSSALLTKGIGTLTYQSPELRESGQKGKYTNKVDIWALGLTLFELYTKQDYSEFFKQNQGLVFKAEGVDKIRNYLIQKLKFHLRNNNKILEKLLKTMEFTIKYNVDNRESIEFFIKIFQDINMENQIDKIDQITEEDERIKKLQRRKKNQVVSKIQMYKNINKKLDRLIESAQNSPNILMKKAMLSNLQREKKQNNLILEQYSVISQNIDKIIRSIKDGYKECDIEELSENMEESFTMMKNILNDFRQQESKKLDLCFMIDVTGSMDQLIHTVQKNITQISVIVKSYYKNIRFSCVAYRDVDIQQNHQPEIFQFMSDKQLLQQIKGLDAYGGGDFAQDINGGFQGIFNLDWNQYTKAIIHFTDAPCHLKQYNDLQDSDDDTYLNKNPPKNNLDYKKIFKEFKSVGINYFFIPIGQSEISKKSLNFMFKKFEEDWRYSKVYRGRCNLIGQINKISQFNLQQFKSIIEGVSKETKIITKKTIKVKRRMGNQQLNQISAADEINQNDEFDK